MKETQKSISDWANATFGSTGSNLRVAIRANEELSELLQVLVKDDNDPKAIVEVADVIIVLMRLAERSGYNIEDEIDRKMAINRARQWVLDGSGCGHHKKEA